MDSQAGRIVVGYDGSAHAGAAVDWAAAEAERRELPLTVLHVADDLVTMPVPFGVPAWLPDLAEAADTGVVREGVERARKTAPSVEVTAVTGSPPVGRALVESSRDAALLVVGTRGHGDIAGTVLGSVAFAVSGHAHCPVVVVRGDSTLAPGPQHPVAVGVDGSTASIDAVRFAADVAARAGAPLLLVTAYRRVSRAAWGGSVVVALDVPGGQQVEAFVRETAEHDAARAAEAALERHPDLPVRRHVVAGAPSAVLIDAAAGCGELVVGSRGRGGFAGLMLGSVGHDMIHAAPCPVAVVPSDVHQSD